MFSTSAAGLAGAPLPRTVAEMPSLHEADENQDILRRGSKVYISTEAPSLSRCLSFNPTGQSAAHQSLDDKGTFLADILRILLSARNSPTDLTYVYSRLRDVLFRFERSPGHRPFGGVDIPNVTIAVLRHTTTFIALDDRRITPAMKVGARIVQDLTWLLLNRAVDDHRAIESRWAWDDEWRLKGLKGLKGYVNFVRGLLKECSPFGIGVPPPQGSWCKYLLETAKKGLGDGGWDDFVSAEGSDEGIPLVTLERFEDAAYGAYRTTDEEMTLEGLDPSVEEFVRSARNDTKTMFKEMRTSMVELLSKSLEEHVSRDRFVVVLLRELRRHHLYVDPWLFPELLPPPSPTPPVNHLVDWFALAKSLKTDPSVSSKERSTILTQRFEQWREEVPRDEEKRGQRRRREMVELRMQERGARIKREKEKAEGPASEPTEGATSEPKELV